MSQTREVSATIYTRKKQEQLTLTFLLEGDLYCWITKLQRGTNELNLNKHALPLIARYYNGWTGDYTDDPKIVYCTLGVNPLQPAEPKSILRISIAKLEITGEGEVRARIEIPGFGEDGASLHIACEAWLADTAKMSELDRQRIARNRAEGRM